MELEAIGKRPRASSGSDSSLASDRLSALPDCIIHHIMSFLKERQVVQTCVLSTRWRHLWRSVPCLDIDQEEFKTEGLKRDKKKEWYEFEDFTDHLLTPNNISIAHLDTFRLHVSRPQTWNDQEKQAARWIRRGMKYSRQDPSIQHKELNSTPWRLKRLHLSNIYLDDSFTNHVNSRCQYLEELELKDCLCAFREITSHTLKKLILKNCKCSGLSAVTSPLLKRLVIDACQNASNCQLVIMAPEVAYLLLYVLVWTFSGGVLLNGMPSLAKASIYLRGNNERESKFGDDQFKLLNSVSNVKSLHLSDFKAMVIGGELPEFQNLRSLLLENCDLSDNFQMLEHFLQHSPNLEKLTLRYCKYSRDHKKKKGKAKLNKGCLNQLNVRCKNLKHTKIIYKDDDVQKLVELLLSVSRDLPKNNIKLTKKG